MLAIVKTCPSNAYSKHFAFLLLKYDYYPYFVLFFFSSPKSLSLSACGYRNPVTVKPSAVVDKSNNAIVVSQTVGASPESLDIRSQSDLFNPAFNTLAYVSSIRLSNLG
ncbi:MAG: hypothetical protein LBG15_02530 [Dysgonamonadaceae bacterium]|jgi:hypothetical protein|nr:hypothetical protein [Dysgonamonadaceae bacterium]